MASTNKISSSGMSKADQNDHKSRLGKGDEKYKETTTEEVSQDVVTFLKTGNRDGVKESKKREETTTIVTNSNVQEHSWTETYHKQEGKKRSESHVVERNQEEEPVARTDGDLENDVEIKVEASKKREDAFKKREGCKSYLTPENGGAPPSSEAVTEVTFGSAKKRSSVDVSDIESKNGQFPVQGEPLDVTEEITYIPFGTRFPEALKTSEWEATQSNTVRSSYDQQKLFVCPNIPGIHTLALLLIIVLSSGVFVRCARTIVDSTDVYCSCDDVVCGMHRLSVRTLNLLRFYPNCTRWELVTGIFFYFIF